MNESDVRFADTTVPAERGRDRVCHSERSEESAFAGDEVPLRRTKASPIGVARAVGDSSGRKRRPPLPRNDSAHRQPRAAGPHQSASLRDTHRDRAYAAEMMRAAGHAAGAALNRDAAAEVEADRLLSEQPGVYTARQLRGKARRETPLSALGGDGERALDAEDWLTLRGLAALRPRQRLQILYDRLNDSERRAMIRWLDGATQAEIAAELGVSQPRVCKMLAQAVIKCRDSCVLYEGSPAEGEFWWLVREAERSVYRPPERVWRHQRAPDAALARSLRDKGQTFLFFVNVP